MATKSSASNMYDVLSEVVKFSFSWTKNKEMQKLYVGLAVAYFFFSFFAPTSLGSLLNFQATGAMGLVAVLVLAVSFLASLYLSFKVLFKTMALRFSKLREFNLENVAMLIGLQIMTFFAGLFSVFETKWLALLGAAAIFGIGSMLTVSPDGSGGVLSIALIALAAICALAYLVIVIRNLVRLSPAAGLYLQGKKLTESLTASWNLTPRKAMKIFLIFIVPGIIVAALTGIEIFISAVLAVVEGNWAIGAVPIQPISAVLNGLVSAFSEIFQTFTYVAMLTWLFKATGKTTTKAKK